MVKDFCPFDCKNARNRVIYKKNTLLGRMWHMAIPWGKMEVSIMAKAMVFFAEGYEEVEALTVVDLLRRAKMEVEMVSVTGEILVKSSHQVTVKMDSLFENADIDSADILVLPGGLPGTNNLREHEGLKQYILKFAANPEKKVAAICAAPSVLAAHGVLQGKKATSYPSFMDKLDGAVLSEEPVVVSDNIITSRGLGTAIPFAAEIVKEYCGEEVSNHILDSIIYGR